MLNFIYTSEYTVLDECNDNFTAGRLFSQHLSTYILADKYDIPTLKSEAFRQLEEFFETTDYLKADRADLETIVHHIDLAIPQLQKTDRPLRLLARQLCARMFIAERNKLKEGRYGEEFDDSDYNLLDESKLLAWEAGIDESKDMADDATEGEYRLVKSSKFFKLLEESPQFAQYFIFATIAEYEEVLSGQDLTFKAMLTEEQIRNMASIDELKKRCKRLSDILRQEDNIMKGTCPYCKQYCVWVCQIAIDPILGFDFRCGSCSKRFLNDY